MPFIAAVLASVLVGGSSPQGAAAAAASAVVAPDPSCLLSTLPRNDDQSAGPVPLGFTVDFLGPESSVFVNNNGNISFDDPISHHHAPDGFDSKLVAPFFADVDTTNVASGQVTYGACPFEGRPAFYATWPGVGYYKGRADKLNSFQVVLVDRSDIGPGDFDVVLNYERIVWEAGEGTDAVGGIGGYMPPRAGFRAGDDLEVELPGSGVSLAFLDSSPTALVARSLNAGGVPGRLRFPIRDGQLAGAPVPPGGLAATGGKGPLRVDLSWDAAAGGAFGVAGYEVLRDGVVVAAPAGTGYTDTAVEWGRAYAYAVRTMDAIGNRSAPASVGGTAPAADPPAVPGAFGGAGHEGPLRIELGWAPSTGDLGVVAYEVVRDGSVVGAVSGTGYTDIAVSWGQSYAYAVRAVDALGNRSAPASATISAPAPGRPSPPGSLTAAPRTGPLRIELAWAPSAAAAGVAAYEVLRDGSVVATVTAAAYADASVRSGRRYVYAVRAVDPLGGRGAEAVATAIAPDVVAPSRPVRLRAVLATVKGKRLAKLSWRAASDAGGVAGYRVYRAGRLVKTTKGLAFAAAAPPRGKAHAYEVRAFDRAGNVGLPARVTVKSRLA